MQQLARELALELRHAGLGQGAVGDNHTFVVGHLLLSVADVERDTPQGIGLFTERLDPQHPHSLFLAGAAAMEAGDNRKGIAYWEALLPQVEPGSEIDQMLRSGIDKMKQGK